MSQTKKDLKLVEVHGQKLTVTSLIVSELFERPHHMVLKSLDKLVSKVHFDFRDYIDSRGKSQRMAVLTERQFLIAMPFIGGTKSFEGQVKLVDEFLRLQKLLNDPDRKTVLIEKRKAGSAMCDGLQFVRELLGKETDAIKYGNEYKFCWRALTGKWDKQDESTLDAYDLRLLEKIRNHNTVLIALHPLQKDRKQLLDDFVTAYRIKFPRLQLVCDV